MTTNQHPVCYITRLKDVYLNNIYVESVILNFKIKH